ncbi:MAG: ATP-binding protein [Clostridiales bacterium]
MIKDSIAFKLIMGFVVIVLVSMLILGVFFIQFFRQFTFDSKRDDMYIKAESIAAIISNIKTGNAQMMGLGGLTNFLNILDVKVWITDENGEPDVISGKGRGVFASEKVPDSTKNIINKALNGEKNSYQGYNSYYEEETLIVGVPVENTQGDILGSVLLMASVKEITDTVDKSVKILGFGILVGLFVSVFLGVSYSLFFTNPLKKMNKIAILMKNGDFTVRTGIKSKDELGQLGESLDMLAEKLNQTINELFQEKGKLENIIYSISDGLIAFDMNLNPIGSNESLRKIMDKNLPYSHDDIKDDFNSINIFEDINNVIKNKEKKVIIRNWHDKILKITINYILDNENIVQGSVVLIQDISESERLEQMRKDFVANVSHEFRTPLTVMKGSLEALYDGTVFEKEDILRYYGRMISETKGLERLVGDLLELSRLQSGKISINKEKLHVVNLIKDTVKGLQTIADKKDIIIKEDFPKIIPSIIADYDRLRQLMIIFIDNAIKYSTEKTIIEVKILFEDNLKIFIKDQGFGIKEDELPYVWDRFYKSDRSRKPGGTGLGLAIAKHLVKLHNGDVSMTSKIGEGTIVKIELPK